MNGLYVDTGKRCPTAVVDGSCRGPWKTGQNHVRDTRRVHGPLHGGVNGLYVDTGKKCPTAVVDGSGRAPWITRQKHLKGAVNGLYEDTGKTGRQPSWTEVDARHAKLGKTTYVAHAA